MLQTTMPASIMLTCTQVRKKAQSANLVLHLPNRTPQTKTNQLIHCSGGNLWA